MAYVRPRRMFRSSIFRPRSFYSLCDRIDFLPVQKALRVEHISRILCNNIRPVCDRGADFFRFERHPVVANQAPVCQRPIFIFEHLAWKWFGCGTIIRRSEHRISGFCCASPQSSSGNPFLPRTGSAASCGIRPWTCMQLIAFRQVRSCLFLIMVALAALTDIISYKQGLLHVVCSRFFVYHHPKISCIYIMFSSLPLIL